MSARPQRIASSPDEVEAALRTLGLTSNIVRDVITHAAYFVTLVTGPLDPKTYPSIVFWAAQVRRLRELLIPKGWQRIDDLNHPLIESPDNRVRIMVAAGDEETGNPRGRPQTKNKKGPATFSAVHRNRHQLLLFGQHPLLSTEETDPLTWVLLVHRTAEFIKAEVSLPVVADYEGYLVEWESRIILPNITTIQGGSSLAPRPLGPINIPVSKRRSPFSR